MFTTNAVFSSKTSIVPAFVRPNVIANARIQSRMVVVASAKPAKASALRTEFATTAAIEEEVQRIKADMFTARIKFAKREDYKPAQYKAMRKRIAQLLTIKRERELVEGINKRDSRAAEKRRLVEAGLGQF